MSKVGWDAGLISVCAVGSSCYLYFASFRYDSCRNSALPALQGRLLNEKLGYESIIWIPPCYGHILENTLDLYRSPNFS